MRANRNSIGHTMTFTPWCSEPPTRPGLYVASTERSDAMRAFFDGAAWSAQVDDDASDDAHDTARTTLMDPTHARSIEWRGLTRRSAEWLAAELVR